MLNIFLSHHWLSVLGSNFVSVFIKDGKKKHWKPIILDPLPRAYLNAHHLGKMGFVHAVCQRFEHFHAKPVRLSAIQRRHEWHRQKWPEFCFPCEFTCSSIARLRFSLVHSFFLSALLGLTNFCNINYELDSSEKLKQKPACFLSFCMYGSYSLFEIDEIEYAQSSTGWLIVCKNMRLTRFFSILLWVSERQWLCIHMNAHPHTVVDNTHRALRRCT